MKILSYTFFALCILSLTSCDERCEDKEFLLRARFTDSTGKIIKPNFQRVYGVGGRGNIAISNDNYFLPLDLSKDSVIYVFETNTSSDTLAIKYSRELKNESESQGYCIRLTQERILEMTTLETKCLNFEGNNTCSEYAVLIKL